MDDDYIPFEGPLHKDRGARQLSQDEARQLGEIVRKVRERRQARGASKLDYLVDRRRRPR